MLLHLTAICPCLAAAPCACRKYSIDATPVPWENDVDTAAMLDNLRTHKFQALVLDSPVVQYFAAQAEQCDLFPIGGCDTSMNDLLSYAWCVITNPRKSREEVCVTMRPPWTPHAPQRLLRCDTPGVSCMMHDAAYRVAALWQPSVLGHGAAAGLSGSAVLCSTAQAEQCD
jgi:hypothetical protein